MDTCQAAIDSILTIYTGNEPNALGRVAENNNGCPNNPDGTTNFGSKVAERSVWYRWTAPFSGSARLDTCTTNFDTLLSVSPGSFGLIATNNNHPDCPQDTFGSKLSFDALRGQTYYIAVDGCCGAPQGTFTLALDLVGDVAPNTRIIGGPNEGSATSNTSVTFTFDADEPGSTFECRVYPAALTGPAFEDCSGAGTHTASGFSQGTYSLEARSTDAAGNLDQTSAKRTFKVDTAGPIGSVLINGGKAPTRKRTVTLTLQANDPAPDSGVSSMRIANSSSALASAEWAPFATSKSWKLSGRRSKTKTVYLQHRDWAGNVSAVVLDRISYRR